jgi:hypothetical protein
MSKKKSKGKMVHVRIATLAYQIALLSYDKCASKSNEFFKIHPDPHKFAKAFQIKYVPLARQALAALLNDPSLDEKQKDEIAECLFADRTIPLGDITAALPAITHH